MLSRGVLPPENICSGIRIRIISSASCGIERASVAMKMPIAVVANRCSAVVSRNSAVEPSAGTPASALFMLPAAMACTWRGFAGREALRGGQDLAHNILIVLALLSAISFLPRLIRRLRTPPMLSVEALREQPEGGDRVLLAGVRPATDFDGEWAHIPGARSMPLEALPVRLGELGHERPVRLVCRTARRSALGARRRRK